MRSPRRLEPPRALLVTLPLALLAMAASAAGILLPETYAAEAPAWAAQATGQDIVTLFLVCPALGVLAARARRGSLGAYLGWLGLLGYLAYSYLLYAGYTHFSGWFPVYVAILALSSWGLVAGLLPLRPVAVAAAFPRGGARRLAGAWLAFFGLAYAVLELAVIGGAIARNAPPASAVTAGLPTDPVLMLDLAFVLPGMAVCGVLARRGRPLALQLVVPLLAFSTAMGTAVLTMLIVTGLRIPPLPVPLIAGFVLLTGGHAAVLARVLRRLGPRIRLGDAVAAAPSTTASSRPGMPAHSR